jgi:Rrf2 family transcriptional regulator, iron-sulfur cluster assembly transcription factor
MQITRTADYGVRLMTRLAAAPPGARMTVSELARESGASSAFTGKILQRLAGARLLGSRRGFEGGFELARPADRISVLDIVSALDGPLCLNDCLPGGGGCEREPWCAAYDVWVRAQAALAAVLGAASLDRLAAAVPEPEAASRGSNGHD